MILVAGGAVLHGSLSEKNKAGDLPSATGATGTFREMGKKPYAEVNIGFKNILQFFRVDLVHRLTYPELDAPKWGVRMSVAVNP